MNLPINNFNDYPVFYRFYENAKIYGAKITLREYSEKANGMILCSGFFFKPIIVGVKANKISNEKND